MERGWHLQYLRGMRYSVRVCASAGGGEEMTGEPNGEAWDRFRLSMESTYRKTSTRHQGNEVSSRIACLSVSCVVPCLALSCVVVLSGLRFV